MIKKYIKRPIGVEAIVRIINANGFLIAEALDLVE